MPKRRLSFETVRRYRTVFFRQWYGYLLGVLLPPTLHQKKLCNLDKAPTVVVDSYSVKLSA